MTYTTEQDARAVLLPAFDETRLSDQVCRFLDKGGVSILMGESRSEYVARQMTAERRSSETLETFRQVTGSAKTDKPGAVHLGWLGFPAGQPVHHHRSNLAEDC